MKKLYTLLLLTAFAFSASAQNLVVNGNFESWDDDTTPTGFSPAPFTAAVTKESTVVFEGAFSAKHTTLATGSVKIQKEISGIVPGHSYTISYRYLDNDANARSRMWSYWLTSALATITVGDDSDGMMRPSTYSEDGANWAIYTITVTAPAGASTLRFETRTYSQNAMSGVVYYDDFKLVDNSLSIKNNEIQGLKIYPNPVTNGTLYITSQANAERNVQVYDVLGKQIVNTTTSANAINVSSLKAGVYIVKITEEGNTVSRKFVIK